MFEGVTIRASDREASERFYATVLRTLGGEWGEFSLADAGDGKPVTRRLHVAFLAPTREHVDEFWRAGTGAGYRDDGGPGPRPQYSESYYGAFLLDPDGNSAEAVHHDSPHAGSVDHLWIRVADVAAAKRFYEALVPRTGFELDDGDTPEKARFAWREGGSFSLVAGRPTEHVGLRFAALDGATASLVDPDGNEVELV